MFSSCTFNDRDTLAGVPTPEMIGSKNPFTHILSNLLS